MANAVPADTQKGPCFGRGPFLVNSQSSTPHPINYMIRGAQSVESL